jgi:outer membrane lipoprotein-sorting protein
VVVIGGGAAAGTIVASADPSLPERSAAQLLVDVQNARVDGFSGTVVQTADLGLPALPGLTGGGGDADLSRLIAGSNSARVWYAGQERMRVALLGTMGETDVIRNGSDVWIWRSRDNSASHLTIPAGTERKPQALPTGVPSTPQEAADAALAAIDPTTEVTTTGAAEVAGRPAYELVLAPRDTQSLIGQVRLAIDAEEHIPLRVDVFAKGANDPAIRVAFQQISFQVPDAEQFTFNPPPGAKVEQAKPEEARPDKSHPDKSNRVQELTEKHAGKVPADRPAAEAGPTVVGKGWTSVVVAKMEKSSGTENAQLESVLNALPRVSGSWGSGRLLAGKLFSVLVTDDGRVLAGAVAPENLYQVASR